MRNTHETPRVVFINPPFLARFSRESRSPAVAKSGTLYYPQWLGYAAAYTRHNGYRIDLIDACATLISNEALLARIHNSEPQVIIVNTSTPSVYSDLRFADMLKRARPNARVFMVGPHISATVKESFEYLRAADLMIDGILVGEFDQIVVEIAQRLRERADFRTAPGLAYSVDDGEVVQNPKPSLLLNMDGWPLVTQLYHEFLDVRAYFYSHSPHPLVTIITGRGCPYRCTFCQLPQVMHGHTYRTRSISDVVREFESLHREMPYLKTIMIEDDTFTADKARVRDLCRALIEAKLTKIAWTCNARPDVDLETMVLMKRAGARLLCVGIESGDQEILNKMKKGTKLSIIARFANDARRAGLLIHAGFMFGNKFDTWETMERTLQFALSLPIDTAQFYPIMLSPGTADYDYFKAQGLLLSEKFDDWNDAEGNHRTTVSLGELTSQSLEQFCDHARRAFYLRRSYIAYKIRQVLLDPREWKRNVMAMKRLWRHLLYRPGQASPVSHHASP